MNKQIVLDGQYQRDRQLFRWHPELMAHPAFRRARSSQILETVRDKVPPEVFTTPYNNPVGGNAGSGARQSARSRAPAEGGGITRSATSKLVDAKAGKPVSVEFLTRTSPTVRADRAVLQALRSNASA